MQQYIAVNYLPILIFFIIALIMSITIIGLPRLLAKFKPSSGKLAPYECGFDPFGDARDKFDIRFYLVAILFIIFDLEIMFLIPWAISLSKIGLYGFWSMMFFLGVLTIGLWYEYKKGALEWE
ncbi:MAG: NADH-quinone oxidoreductase subunit A [Rickettsiaceae bacterium]|nr:NADH-quinone oxidoreductase subunit A [Rickettsiaceae bacterium]